jgi:NADH-quinone oxidoreductase subunit M
MILVWCILIPFAAGILAWLFAPRSAAACRWISLLAPAASFLLALRTGVDGGAHGRWLAEFKVPWIPAWGVSFSLALDGLSLALVLLTNFVGVLAVAASWRGVQERIGFFHFNLMWATAAISGGFMAMDLFLFYVFWEVMLVPLYFLIVLWGHERRVYAAIKFFLFTQASGLLMLVGILGLYFIHGRATGVYTFEYRDLLNTPMSSSAALWLFLAFFAAFAVKLPAVPLHTWLPDAHSEAPTAGSVILAALVLKVGAYGLLRYAVPLFPYAADAFSPYAMTLGVIGILYGAWLAFAQPDLKRLVAYTSVSHMGFVLLGIFAGNAVALNGVAAVMVAHGISTGALFILAGQLYERMHTYDLNRMGGLWETAPRLGGFTLFFALASLGLPGTANFIGEFLVLLGTYSDHIAFAAFASLGLVASVIYALWMVQRVFQGPNRERWRFPDSVPRETAVAAVLVAATLWLGLYPAPLLRMVGPALEQALSRGPRMRRPELLLTRSPTPGLVPSPHLRPERAMANPEGAGGTL